MLPLLLDVRNVHLQKKIEQGITAQGIKVQPFYVNEDHILLVTTCNFLLIKAEIKKSDRERLCNSLMSGRCYVLIGELSNSGAPHLSEHIERLHHISLYLELKLDELLCQPLLRLPTQLQHLPVW